MAVASADRARRLLLEQLHARRMLAPLYTNSFNEFDVDDDGFAAPIDALLVINDLNLIGSWPLPPPNSTPAEFIDVSTRCP
jgi:hypothetical protein